MSAYYNEIDPEKAQWIRELIKANVVAPGDVDERDIKLPHVQGGCALPGTAALASVITPQACSPNSLRGKGQDPMKRKAGGHAVNLQDQVTLYESGAAPDGSILSRLDQLPRQAQTRGFWADCDWWYGRDGKYRPIEPGLFPLAHGAANRVLKLRGYGDAINAEVAKAFIEAYLG